MWTYTSIPRLGCSMLNRFLLETNNLADLCFCMIAKDLSTSQNVHTDVHMEKGKGGSPSVTQCCRHRHRKSKKNTDVTYCLFTYLLAFNSGPIV